MIRRAVAASNSPRPATDSACRAVPGLVGVSPPHGVATSPVTAWYEEAITGTPRTQPGLPAAAEDSFDVTESDTIESVRADYDRACGLAREVAASHDPDDVLTGHRLGAMTVRWIHLQVLRELAQHSGHADILREQLLAARGRSGTRRAAAIRLMPGRRLAIAILEC